MRARVPTILISKITRRGRLTSNSLFIKIPQDFHQTKELLSMNQINKIVSSMLRAVGQVAQNNNRRQLRKCILNLEQKVVGEVHHKVGLLY